MKDIETIIFISREEISHERHKSQIHIQITNPKLQPQNSSFIQITRRRNQKSVSKPLPLMGDLSFSLRQESVYRIPELEFENSRIPELRMSWLLVVIIRERTREREDARLRSGAVATSHVACHAEI